MLQTMNCDLLAWCNMLSLSRNGRWCISCEHISRNCKTRWREAVVGDDPEMTLGMSEMSLTGGGVKSAISRSLMRRKACHTKQMAIQ